MTVVVTTDLTTDEARRRPDGEMVLSVTTTQATPEYARNLTDRIKVGLDFTWVMVKEAYQVRAHAALRYSSWDDYCEQEFEGRRIRIPREDRPDAVSSLRDAGLSIRAIASATGLSRSQIGRDVATVPNGTVATPATEANAPVAPPAEPKTITGVNGKTYAHKAKPEPSPELKSPPASKPRQKQPVLEGDALAKADAEQICEDLGSALGSIEGLMVSEHRARVIDAWKTGSLGATPHNRELHTPATIRHLADALITYAAELELANV